MSNLEKLGDLIGSFGMRNATLPNVLEMKAEENKDKIFVAFHDKEISYKEVNERANRIANGLLKLNIGRKPKIALMLPNIPEFMYCWFGISKIGAVIVPVNIHLKGVMLQYILEHSDSEHIILDFPYLKAFETIKKQVPRIKQVIVCNAPESIKLDSSYLRYEQIYDSNTENPSIKVRNFQPMQILYTSGTTGRPKGILYRHYFVLAGLFVYNQLKEENFTDKDILYCSLPLFHGFPQFLNLLPTMFLNGKIVIADKFHVSTFWDDVKKYKATIVCYIGGMLQILLKQPMKESERTHEVKVAFGGGCPKSIWEEFEKRFHVKIYEGWSLSEAVGMTLNRVGSEGGKAGSIGKSVEGFMLKIVDENGKEVPPGIPGEILAKSTLPILLEYYKKPDKAKTETDADGWAHTGDIGYQDEDGYVFFTGRKKDMIRRMGENIAAEEVERVANLHPSIIETAAFAVPREEVLGEEEVKIVAVLKENESLTPVELLDFMKDKTAYFMLPRYIEFKTQIEMAHYKTATERIKKFELKNESQNEVIKKKTWDGVKANYNYKSS